MTNASVKNTFAVLSAVAIIATALSLGAFATTVRAADDGTDFGYIDPGYTDYGYVDPGYTDYGYNNPGYTDYGYVDPGYTDYGYTNPGYTDYGYNDAGYTDYSYEPYTYDTGYMDYGYGGSYGYSGGSYGSSYRPSTPTTFYAPGYAPRTTTVSAPVQQQQQQQQQQSGGPINIVNNNVNTNTNTNVAPVSYATPQSVVQYVYQQQSYPSYYPVYQPTYNYPTYYNQLPTCTITATTGYNGLVTLYWSSSYGTSAYISPSVGSVAPNGSTSLYNYGNTIYTMTVSGQGGSNTCRTNYINTYVPPVQTPSVSLTQIPYTGFDFGPVGNAMYWMSLLAFAVAGAYLLVYFRGGAVALAGSTLGSFRRKSEVTVAHAPVAKAPAVVPVAPKAVATFENLPTMQSASTRDSMSISRTATGAPRIVVNRS